MEMDFTTLRKGYSYYFKFLFFSKKDNNENGVKDSNLKISESILQIKTRMREILLTVSLLGLKKLDYAFKNIPEST